MESVLWKVLFSNEHIFSSSDYQVSFSFTFRKIIPGSLDQSDARFGETAGSQCICNAFFSVCVFRYKNSEVLDSLGIRLYFE